MNSPSILPSLKNRLISGFKELEASLNGEANSAVFQMRRKAIDLFDQLGFPDLKNEEWKYTHINRFLDEDWRQKPTGTKTGNTLTEQSLNKALVFEGKAHLLVFEDGSFRPDLSNIHSEDICLTIMPFSEAVHTGLAAPYFGKAIASGTNGFTALNAAFAQGGIYIHVAAGQTPKYPVHLVFASGTGSDKTIVPLRNLIILESDASLELVETWLSAGEKEYMVNAATEVFVGAHAKFNQYTFQREDETKAIHVGFTGIVQQKDSLANHFTVTTGGRLVRNDLQFRLKDSNCESHLYGLYIGTGNQHIDNHTLVDHAMPQCFSNEIYKGIMAGQSNGVFNGKVLVRPDAQKTNAYQSNKNILLSDEARVNTKPQLEIFANDVKCSHGATTGQLDEDALFYLRARGIGAAEAKAMLTAAFASDVLENIKNESIREYATALARQKLNTPGTVLSSK